MKQRVIFLLFFLVTALSVMAQSAVTGRVLDIATQEPLPFVNVFFPGGRGVQTNEEGKFSIPYKNARLTISMLGYDSETIRPRAGKNYEIQLRRSEKLLGEAVVRGKKKKYRRKDNPAVVMMRKVIAAKESSNLARHDYYSFNKYCRTTLAFNDVTEKVFEEGKFKRMPFLKDHVEFSPETGKFILPMSVEESVLREIYRKEPQTKKEIVLGEKKSGINSLFQTGDILNAALNECFSDVDIYQDEIMLLQYPFVSPISSKSAISFYRYFIEDTVFVAGDTCYHLTFTPNNQQDFGFSGSLYIMADSTWRVKIVDIGVPPNSAVNWVDRMRVIQQFEQLPTGEQVMVHDNMVVELEILDVLQKAMVKRITDYRDFSFTPIPDEAFDFKEDRYVLDDARLRSESFWQMHRGEELTKTERGMSTFMDSLRTLRFFKPVLFVAKAFVENYVETSTNPDKPSKVDFGPVNTMITGNFVDGLRLRASAITTANLCPHFFLKGYVAYGFKDQKWKGMGEATYSFNKKKYSPHEFPMHNLSVSYTRDVMAPSDKFLPTDKDNVFVSMKWTKVNHMMYYETYRMAYDKEWKNGLRLTAQLRTEKDEPTAALFYQPLSAGVDGQPTATGADHLRSIRTTDATLSFIYRPDATWINTKQRRAVTNHNASRFTLSHTVGHKGVLGSDYSYNFTEASVYKRFWLPKSWGRIDVFAKGGVQWNRVPYPLLIMPMANLSYIIQDEMFLLIDNMEFLNDRYASLMLQWDMSGKIFNRIPLFKRLKWREMIGCNVLWGMLSDKNNPLLPQNAGSRKLFFFPGEFGPNGFVSNTFVMERKKPYVEVFAGIHNIFKIVHVQYVHRLNYNYLPDVSRWGLRLVLRFSF